LMLLSSTPWRGQIYKNDFHYIRHNEPVHLFTPKKWVLIIGTVIAMVTAAAMGVPMVLASMSAALFLMITKSVPFREIRRSVTWNVLILIASAFGVARAVQVTGVATFFAEIILKMVGENPHILIAAIFLATMVTTEFITNVAAALLIFPIAVQTSRLAGFESISALKAVGITIALASSCSFATPIGYQTNTIVYGPGGYKFTDYMRVGIPLSILVFITAMFLIPYFWPLF